MARSSICGFDKRQIIKSAWEWAEAHQEHNTRGRNKRGFYKKDDALYERVISVWWSCRLYTKLGSSMRELDNKDICEKLKKTRLLVKKYALEKREYAFYKSILIWNYKLGFKKEIFIPWGVISFLIKMARKYDEMNDRDA